MSTFSDGKMNENDEGDIKIALFVEGGKVVMDFGKSITWLGFDKQSLLGLIRALQEKVDLI